MIRLKIDWIGENRWCHIREILPSELELLDGFDGQDNHWLCWEDHRGWNAKQSTRI